MPEESGNPLGNLFGSKPTENSDFWNESSEIPANLYFDGYEKNIKVLAVYNNNGEKTVKNGEANYNFKYIKESGNSKPIQMNKGYFNNGYFTDSLGKDKHSAAYVPSQKGKFKIYHLDTMMEQ